MALLWVEQNVRECRFGTAVVSSLAEAICGLLGDVPNYVEL